MCIEKKIENSEHFNLFLFQIVFQKQQQNRKKRPDLPKEWQTSNNGSDQYFQIRNFEEIHVFKDSNLSDDDEDELEGLGSHS